MNELKNFTFDGLNVRVQVINGAPVFCASDVCKVLCYRNGPDAIAKHCRKKGIAKYDTPTNGGTQTLTYIDEPNLYRLILRSKLESAERFQDWVCETVLPSIHHNGGYIAGQENQSPAEILANAMIVANKVIEEQKKKIRNDKPKVLVYDTIVEKNHLYNATQVANKIGKSAFWLNRQLEQLDVYSKSVKRSRAFRQWFMDRGYGIMRRTDNGFSQCMFSAQGEVWVIQKLTEEGVI